MSVKPRAQQYEEATQLELGCIYTCKNDMWPTSIFCGATKDIKNDKVYVKMLSLEENRKYNISYYMLKNAFEKLC